ncbi:MAG: hypothetical protein WDA11_13320 [Thiohalomonadaceae bacterium]
MIIRAAPRALVTSAIAWCPEIVKTKGIIAGGFIRAYYAGEKPSDMDLYFEEEAALKSTQEMLLKNGWDKAAETDRAITLTKNGRAVQLIGFLYGLLYDILEEFDFTICVAALKLHPPEDSGVEEEEKESEGVSGNVWFHDDFFEHLAGRILVYTGSPMPLSSLNRAFKFVKRGYHICDENIIKLSEDIAAKVDFDDAEDVQDHIAGMDPDGARRIRVID